MSEILTYTKKMFDPLHPDAELLDIRDIAHALSMLCRANGHFKTFYSVGQHSINCMKEARARGFSARIQLACLLHDASEAYLSDITRPVKAELPQYKEIESPLQDMIWEKWLGSPLEEDERSLVFAIDDVILAHEFLNLMDTRLTPKISTIFSKPDFAFSGFEATEQEFFRYFYQLTTGKQESLVVGIDWMRPCWLAAEIRGKSISLRKLTHIRQINEYYGEAAAVLIDIPVGLPENTAENACRPDAEARKYLPKGRKSTVFLVPCRQAIQFDHYEQASAENAHVLGKKLPKQAFSFSKTIRQVDDFLANNETWKNRLTESHPELVFQVLNNGIALQHSKHTEAGIQERMDILRMYDIDPTPLLMGYTRSQCEDVLDAVCLALSAKLGSENGFCTIPKTPVRDSRGLKMQMIFGKP